MNVKCLKNVLIKLFFFFVTIVFYATIIGLNELLLAKNLHFYCQ